MQSKFNDIVANGRSINMTVGFDEASSLDMNSEVCNEGLTLADLIEIWLEDNAFQGNFHVQGTTAKRMVVDDVKLPLKDANGRNYSVANFGRDFLRFAQKNNIKIKRDVVGNSLIITIL